MLQGIFVTDLIIHVLAVPFNRRRERTVYRGILVVGRIMETLWPRNSHCNRAQHTSVILQSSQWRPRTLFKSPTLVYALCLRPPFQYRVRSATNDLGIAADQGLRVVLTGAFSRRVGQTHLVASAPHANFDAHT